MSLYVDGHLDLAFNVTAHGRDLTQSVAAIRRQEKRKSQSVLVTLPELQRAEVGVVFGTLFAIPSTFVQPPGSPALNARQKSLTYDTPEAAHRLALEQLEVYEKWEKAGAIRILRSQTDLERHVTLWEAGDRITGVVVLMEGADPIRKPEELAWWVERGVRLVGPAWQRTRYCGGTAAPGPLTDLGRELVHAMREAHVPLDASHLAEESFWDAVDLDPFGLFASHSNARAITPTDRHLTDEMLKEIADRDGVVGLVLGNEFVKDGVKRTDHKESVTIADVRLQATHIAGIVGWERVAIGSDFDGGFGLQETPLEITRGADFKKLGKAAPADAREGLLGGNWLRFLRRVLPQ
ncbi:membrane dipeptidase [soil metagenome]